jgi:ribosomal protein L22
MTTMETRSIVRGVRLSADKGRLVADMVRGKKVDQALNILTSPPRRLPASSRSASSPRSRMPSTTTAPTSTS